MLVISDTSPINYLLLIEQIQILPRLFGGLTIPQAVADELSHPRAPEKTRIFMAARPD